MRKLLLIAPALALTITTPAFPQGATMSPPSPNASNSEPEPPNSTPSGSRTLPSDTTEMQRAGTINTTTTNHGHRHRHHQARRHMANPNTPQARTVPTPQNQ